MTQAAFDEVIKNAEMVATQGREVYLLIKIKKKFSKKDGEVSEVGTEGNPKKLRFKENILRELKLSA